MQNQILEAEQAIIGGVIQKNDAYYDIQGKVKPEDFEQLDHAVIWRTIINLLDNQQPADIITIAEKLEENTTLTPNVNFKYLGELSRDVPTASNVAAYADLLLKKSRVRDSLEALSDATQKITDGDDVVDVISPIFLSKLICSPSALIPFLNL